MFPFDKSTSSRTIFINPNFNKTHTHINPKFLLAQMNPSIHVNPNFLPKEQISTLEISPLNAESIPIPPTQHHTDSQNATVATKVNVSHLPNRIISKSRTKIIRAPMKTITPTSEQATQMSTSSPLIKIGLRKLIRPSTNAKPDLQSHVISANVSRAKYKIDRRVLNVNNPIRKRKTSYTGRYALRRSSSFSKRTASRTFKKKSDTLNFSKIPFKNTSTSKNRQLLLLNINGVLYRSTKNKLERRDVKNITHAPKVSTDKKTAGQRAIFVRGTKYLLDKSGFNLTRAQTAQQPIHQKSLRRIDIGGLTYIANSKNVLVRTDTHLTRNHVSSAKQKSIHMLSRSFVKTNIPCPIYQRVGKCAAFERGKCMKVHDKMHVAICPRFLRGECINKSCLLSHNVSLSKMPVCKFFLQGCCVREDCPYLHKKLSAKADLCIDFLKGFCKLAQKCNKRHEFICPDMEARGKCGKVRCPYCRKQKLQLTKRKDKCVKKTSPVSPVANCSQASDKNDHNESNSEEPNVKTRYFVKDLKELGESFIVSESNDIDTINGVDESDSDEEENAINNSVPCRKRPQLGDLPAFIPFS